MKPRYFKNRNISVIPVSDTDTLSYVPLNPIGLTPIYYYGRRLMKDKEENNKREYPL